MQVVTEDVFTEKDVLLGLGQGAKENTLPHARHSLAQYYFWPEERDKRLENLSGQGDVVWDHVVIFGDPNLVQTMPGFYSFGVNLIAEKVREGGAQPLVFMPWLQAADQAEIEHFSEFTARTADGAMVPVPLIAAATAWNGLDEGKKVSATSHPSPNGAYLSAAAIYSQIFNRSAATSSYNYDDELAEQSYATVLAEAARSPDWAGRSFSSPFQAGGVADRVLNYNQTGSSSENGIRGGLQWVVAKANTQLTSGGAAPLNFNYGRANTNFEANKRYKVDANAYEFSLGFPMQDAGNHGDTSMLYGIDQRRSQSENGTDLGVAFYMAKNSELPEARAVPIRSLYALMKDQIPGQSAYRDSWHMHRDLDKAAGAFIFTLLTGHCALDDEPVDSDSSEWRSWMAHKIGYETAWSMMHLRARAPGLRVIPESTQSVAVTTDDAAELTVSFAFAPVNEVQVSLTVDQSEFVKVTPEVLVFTPENYQQPRTVSLSLKEGATSGKVVLSVSTESKDLSFHRLSDRWEYSLTP